MQAGTQFRASRRLGTALRGLRPQQAVSIALPAQVNADSNATRITTGTRQARPAMLQNRL